MSVGETYDSESWRPLDLVERSIGERVVIMTSAGLEFEGILKGIDASANCVLENVQETNVIDKTVTPRHLRMALVSGAHISIITPKVE